jgi:hypothetical protein
MLKSPAGPSEQLTSPEPQSQPSAAFTRHTQVTGAGHDDGNGMHELLTPHPSPANTVSQNSPIAH